MKLISKKITVYIFVGLLVFCTTSTTYYRSVHAMEWVGGALAFEEALKWTLAVLGITATAGMTDAYWDQYGDDFVDYAIQDGATQAEVAEWQLKLCEGVLDKASSVWISFKNWASSLVGSSSGGGSTVVDGFTIQEVVDIYSSFTGYNLVLDLNNIDVSNVKIVSFYTIGDSITSGFPILMYTHDDFVISSYNPSRPYDYYPVKDGAVVNTDYFLYPTSVNNNTYNLQLRNTPYNARILNNYNFSFFNLTFDINPSYPFTGDIYDLGSYTPDVPDVPDVDDNFQSIPDVDIPSIDVISSDIPDEEDPEINLPFPGLDTSDDSISSDTYDDIIGAINDGTISIEDGIDDIISRLRVISYDEVTGDVIPPRPDPDDPTQNVKKDDVVNDNKNNMGFTLAGLEGVFPFCIPWDIYAFMTLLVSDPVAPEFDFPIKSVNNHTENIHVDLSPFEPVAVVVRYIFDFLFIIGLAMLTRSLIGGGSSD